MIKALYVTAFCFYSTLFLTSCAHFGTKIYEEYRVNKQIEQDAKDILNFPSIG